MTIKTNARQVVKQLVSDDKLWNKIYAIREMDCFVIGMPNEVSVRYNKMQSIIPEPTSCFGINGLCWLIESKNGRPSIQITRQANRDFTIHILDDEIAVLWLEGVDCYKHALLHAYDAIEFLMNMQQR